MNLQLPLVNILHASGTKQELSPGQGALLIVAAAIVVGIAGIVFYHAFWLGRLRPTTADKVAAHLQGDWTGVSANNIQETRTGIITIRRLDGNRIEGAEDCENATSCPDKVFREFSQTPRFPGSSPMSMPLVPFTRSLSWSVV